MKISIPWDVYIRDVQLYEEEIGDEESTRYCGAY
jgi:hypothetical protein